MDLRKLRVLAGEMGVRWLFHRAFYEGKKRSGILEGKARLGRVDVAMPDMGDLAPGEFVRRYCGRFFAADVREYGAQCSLFLDEAERAAVVDAADRAAEGVIRCFSAWDGDYGRPYQWHRDPVSGREIPADRHWSRVPELGSGVDIKLIWEFSRFPQVFYLVRAYGLTQDERYAGVFWEQFESWVENNPYQMGPNWFCGQEAALRVMAWVFGLFVFLDSSHTTAARVKHMITLVHMHGVRIEQNIDYAVKLVQNNHAISEAAGLFTIGVLFPFFKEADRWRKQGYKLLVAEGIRQIYEDGSHLQYSFNYQRMVVQLYSWCLRLGQVNGISFDARLAERLRLCNDFLYQMQDEATGRLPNYGSNDGALVFPLAASEYRDYRPQLNCLHYLLTGTRLYEKGKYDEELFWFCGAEALTAKVAQPERKSAAFRAGGYYVLRSPRGFGFTRCGVFRDRPGHADMLHFDLWWKGRNVLCDAGTYLYNCDAKWSGYFRGTAGHNAVTVDGKDQMNLLSHFMWCGWTKGRVLGFGTRDGCQVFEGEHYGYRSLGAIHRRAIINVDDVWIVVDDLFGGGAETHRLEWHWLLGDFDWEWDERGAGISLQVEDGNYMMGTLAAPGMEMDVVTGLENDAVRGWRSQYYGLKEAVPAVVCGVRTSLPYRFVSAFYPENDVDGVVLDAREVSVRLRNGKSRAWRLGEIGGRAIISG